MLTRLRSIKRHVADQLTEMTISVKIKNILLERYKPIRENDSLR